MSICQACQFHKKIDFEVNVNVALCLHVEHLRKSAFFLPITNYEHFCNLRLYCTYRLAFLSKF